MAIQETNLADLNNQRQIPIQEYLGASDFRSNFLYLKGVIIFRDDKCYRARLTFRSGVEFDIANWEQIAINLLSFAELKGNLLDNEILQQAFLSEAEDRQNAVKYLQTAIDNEAAERQALSDTLDGVQVLILTGALLTRVINGTSSIAKSLFDPSTVFIADKTLIGDANGTLGFYTENADSANLIIKTVSISPLSTAEPTLLGNVASFANLPQTITQATDKGWNTPRIDDYARVLNDETNDNQTTEWYIADIDEGENITWANPVIINTGDYQAQTSAIDAGRVLVGGASAGTFGASKDIDTVPTANSPNLITSSAVKSAIDSLNKITEYLPKRFMQYSVNGRRLLSVKAGTVLILNDKVLSCAVDIDIDITAALDTGSVQNGRDYYIYIAAVDADSEPTFAISLSKTNPAGFAYYRLLGGFHTLCANSGVIPNYTKGGVSTPHPASGYLAGDIIPISIWCINFRPISEPEGMVYIKDLDFWADIYLQSGTGFDTKSVYDAVSTRGRYYTDHVEDMFCVKKMLLNDEEFSCAMIGSNEGTSLGYKNIYTGGKSDSDGRRMISAYFIEEGCGLFYQYLSTTWFQASIAGGIWNSPNISGSTERSTQYRTAQYIDCGGRGRSRPLI